MTTKDQMREYHCWAMIKQRCLNPKNHRYHRYGGRGIKMHTEWQSSFDAFLRDVGLRPSSKHSIDRINNDGNYEPGNVRWATAEQQYSNRAPRGKSQNKKEYKGRIDVAAAQKMYVMGMSTVDIGRHFGVSRQAVSLCFSKHGVDVYALIEKRWKFQKKQARAVRAMMRRPGDKSAGGRPPKSKKLKR